MAKTVFSDGNPSQGILGTIVTAAALNGMQNHRHDGADADGSAPILYAADTGAANAYAIALTPALTAHVTGMPIVFKALTANTGASTLAVNGLAAVAIKQMDGSDLPAGAIVAGQMVTVIYTGAAYMLVSGYGIATDTEVQAGTDTSKIVTSGRLYNALSALATKAGFAISLTTNGYIKFPSWLGGVIFQWGVLGDASWVANTFRTINYPVTFPNNALQNVASMSNSAGTLGRVNTNALSNSQIQLMVDYSGAATVRWVAVGY